MSVLMPKMCHLPCLLRLFWHPEGPSGDSGALWSTRRETLGSRLGFLLVADRFRDRTLRVFCKFWSKICVCFMRVYRLRFSMISGSESGCLELQNHVSWDSIDFGVIFICFPMALEIILVICCALHTGGFPVGAELKDHGRLRVKGQ